MLRVYKYQHLKIVFDYKYIDISIYHTSWREGNSSFVHPFPKLIYSEMTKMNLQHLITLDTKHLWVWGLQFVQKKGLTFFKVVHRKIIIYKQHLKIFFYRNTRLVYTKLKIQFTRRAIGDISYSREDNCEK